jgi:hypothetical protein
VVNRNNGQLQLCVNGNPVGPPEPAPFLGWKPERFYTVSLTVDTETGMVATVLYHGHNISKEFDKLTHGFVKSVTAYAGFYGLSGSSVKDTGRVAKFSVMGRPAAFYGHMRGIGNFARSAPRLPTAPELPHPVQRGAREVILGYPLAYVWNVGIDHPAQESVLRWAIKHTWGPRK